MTVEVTSQLEVITPRILSLCQEGGRLLQWEARGQMMTKTITGVLPTVTACCILSGGPSVEQNYGRFMDKMRIIKRICSNDCILNDQCDDGITLTLSCALYIFDIFNSISSPGPRVGWGLLLLCYSTLPQDTHPLPPLVTPARGQRPIQSCDAELSPARDISLLFQECYKDDSFLSQMPVISRCRSSPGQKPAK